MGAVQGRTFEEQNQELALAASCGQGSSSSGGSGSSEDGGGRRTGSGGSPREAHVITFSHFLPRPELPFAKHV